MIFPIDIRYIKSCKDTAYASDNGADISCPKGTPIVAIADGTIIYSEHGHAKSYPGFEAVDTRYSIRFKLDTPIQGFPEVFYTHLSKLAFTEHNYGRRVRQGEYLGETGVARGNKHLHISLYYGQQFMPPFVLRDFLWKEVLPEQLNKKRDNSIVETEDEMAFKEAFALMDNHRKVNFRIDITNGWGVSKELSRGGKENAWYESKAQTKHFPGGKLEQIPPDTDNSIRVQTVDGKILASSPKKFGQVKHIVDGSIFIKQSGLLNKKTYLYLSYIYEL